MSVFTALVAAGAVLVSMILSVSLPRLWTLFDTSATKALNLLNEAMNVSPGDGLVMAGLVPAIHAFGLQMSQDVNARDKRGHDGSQFLIDRIVICLSRL